MSTCQCSSCMRLEEALEAEWLAQAEYDFSSVILRLARIGRPGVLNIDIPSLDAAYRMEEEARKALLAARTRADYWQGIVELAHLPRG